MSRLMNWLLSKKRDLKVNKYNNLDLYVPYFSGKYDPELNTTYVNICNAHARQISKIRPRVIQNNQVSKSKEYITKLLSLKPNPLMTASKLWGMLARDYFMTNNAMAFIEWDYSNFKEPLKAIWPLDPDKNSIDIVSGNGGKVYVKFNLEGEEYVTDIDNIILLTRDAKPAELFGYNNKAIATILKILQTNYEGIEQAIKTSAFIRFLVQSTTPLTEEIKKQKAKYFAETYLGKDASGVAYIDQAQSIIKVDSQAKYANVEEMKEFKNEIYCYLGGNEKILKAEYTEDDWQSYYESVIEPFIIQLEEELTVKLFTDKEIVNGYQIEIGDNRLQTASMKTRATLAAIYMKLPVIKPNVVTDLLYLPRLENGDKEYSTLNYVQADKQNQYQEVLDNPVIEDTEVEKDEK